MILAFHQTKQDNACWLILVGDRALVHSTDRKGQIFPLYMPCKLRLVFWDFAEGGILKLASVEFTLGFGGGGQPPQQAEL